MATHTVHVADQAGGLVSWDYDWDDATNVVTALRCTNDSDQPARARIWNVETPNKVFEKVTDAHTVDNIVLGQNQATRFNLVITNDRVANLDGVFTWPA